VNGPAVGQRAACLLAAAFLVVGCSIGFGTPPSPTAPLADPVSVVEAATDGGPSDSPALDGIGNPRRSSPWTTGLETALGAEGFDTTWTVPAVPPPAPPAPVPAPPKPSPVWWARYVGTNHVWMPTLGINRRVYSFPCSRGTSPDNLVYRWGCAGRNNVYLLGHAYGVFKALHDAYWNHKLKVGMPVIYADGHGGVRLYRVVTWRIVQPADAAWAMASQRVPSMTLQTCVGPNGTLRLNVRLVAADS
jgi:hypothetical protein